MLVRGSCLSCHMLTCPRAAVHLLLNQLKLIDVGAMKEVCELPTVLNQVSMKNPITRMLKCGLSAWCRQMSRLSQFLEGSPQASGAEIQGALEEFSAPIIKANHSSDGCAPVSYDKSLHFFLSQMTFSKIITCHCCFPCFFFFMGATSTDRPDQARL